MNLAALFCFFGHTTSPIDCSSFKLSLKKRNKALAQEVTLLKSNNRGLQVQNTALVKEVQAHKFELAASRGNERRLVSVVGHSFPNSSVVFVD